MAKRRRVIKRVYEKGRETTLIAKVRRSTSRKKPRVARKPPVRVETRNSRPSAHVPIGTAQFPGNHPVSSGYNETRLRLLVRDPAWVYAYWDVSTSVVQTLKATLSEEDANRSAYVLRMYDISLIYFNGSNAHRYFDIEVGPDVNNWHINLWSDGVSYIAEIGLRLRDGRFLPAARSNPIHTPRRSFSHRTDQIWMKVTDEATDRPFIQPFITSRSRRKRGLSSHRSHRIKIYLTEDEIRRYYSALSPLLRDIIARRLSRKYGKRARRFIFDKTHLDHMRSKFYVKKRIAGSSEELILIGTIGDQGENPQGSSDLHRNFTPFNP